MDTQRSKPRPGDVTQLNAINPRVASMGQGVATYAISLLLGAAIPAAR